MSAVNYGGARGGGKSPFMWVLSTIDDIEYARLRRKGYRKARHRRADARMVHRLIMQFGLGMKWNGRHWE